MKTMSRRLETQNAKVWGYLQFFKVPQDTHVVASHCGRAISQLYLAIPVCDRGMRDGTRQQIQDVTAEVYGRSKGAEDNWGD